MRPRPSQMTSSLSSVGEKVPVEISSAVLVDSEPPPEGAKTVQGLDWEGAVTLQNLLNSFDTSGYQASAIGAAVNEILRMLKWRPSAEDVASDDNKITSLENRCCIWLAFTSNMISSGLRELFVFLAKEKLVDVIITSAGGIEEDLVKCLAPSYLGEFCLDGSDLRSKGWNRIGNLIVPNDNYCKFEDWVQPILDKCLDEQQKLQKCWTPSKLIERLGITDGSLGDNLYFHSYRHSEDPLRIDVVEDIRRVNDLALNAPMSGMVILGGGIAKHHTCNANLMRNGADFAVYVNTAQEFDGCDSGARPDEAVSWGKIKSTAAPVKVHCDASIAFPLIAAGSFRKYWQEERERR